MRFGHQAFSVALLRLGITGTAPSSQMTCRTYSASYALSAVTATGGLDVSRAASVA
jgi:hypothetical protein